MPFVKADCCLWDTRRQSAATTLASGLLTGKYKEGDPGDTRISLRGYEWLQSQFESDETRQQLVKVKQLGKVADELTVTLPYSRWRGV